MIRTTSTAALALPEPSGWDFSDYPYGLEPLTLPHPHEEFASTGRITQDLVEASCRGFLRRAAEPFERTEPATEDTLERLFWFRWITGHQVSFIIWRLLAEALDRLAARTGDLEEISRAITQYVRGYCGMLLYTGSCSRAVYNQTIRPSMYRQHSTFSGTWAPDYPTVRSLFRGRRVPPVVASEVDDLVREVRMSNQLHLGVAAKLVVGGRSLLQRSIGERDVAQPRMWGAVFDCYFLTLRAKVSRQEVVAQLLRRQKTVAIDLATNGLYPSVSGSASESSDELRGPEVRDYENDLAGCLFRVAGLAAGLRLDLVNAQMDARRPSARGIT